VDSTILDDGGEEVESGDAVLPRDVTRETFWWGLDFGGRALNFDA